MTQSGVPLGPILIPQSHHHFLRAKEPLAQSRDASWRRDLESAHDLDSSGQESANQSGYQTAVIYKIIAIIPLL